VRVEPTRAAKRPAAAARKRAPPPRPEPPADRGENGAQAPLLASGNGVGWPEHWAASGEAQARRAPGAAEKSSSSPRQEPVPFRSTLLQRLAGLVSARRAE